MFSVHTTLRLMTHLNIGATLALALWLATPPLGTPDQSTPVAMAVTPHGGQ